MCSVVCSIVILHRLLRLGLWQILFGVAGGFLRGLSLPGHGRHRDQEQRVEQLLGEVDPA